MAIDTLSTSAIQNNKINEIINVINSLSGSSVPIQVATFTVQSSIATWLTNSPVFTFIRYGNLVFMTWQAITINSANYPQTTVANNPVRTAQTLITQAQYDSLGFGMRPRLWSNTLAIRSGAQGSQSGNMVWGGNAAATGIELWRVIVNASGTIQIQSCGFNLIAGSNQIMNGSIVFVLNDGT